MKSNVLLSYSMGLHVFAVEFNFSEELERYYVEVISHNIEKGHTWH